MAETPPESRSKVLASFVVHVAQSIRLVRAWDEADARDRVRAQHPGFVVADDEIAVRLATTDDEHLLELVQGGSAEFRSAWARNLTDTAA